MWEESGYDRGVLCTDTGDSVGGTWQGGGSEVFPLPQPQGGWLSDMWGTQRVRQHPELKRGLTAEEQSRPKRDGLWTEGKQGSSSLRKGDHRAVKRCSPRARSSRGSCRRCEPRWWASLWCQCSSASSPWCWSWPSAGRSAQGPGRRHLVPAAREAESGRGGPELGDTGVASEGLGTASSAASRVCADRFCTHEHTWATPGTPRLCPPTTQIPHCTFED